MTKSDNPAELLLAALTYQEYGVYDEALKLFEKLAMRMPQEARFHAALGDYYFRSGREADSSAAMKKAKELLEGAPKTSRESSATDK